jgi:hypothetical protein
MKFVCLESLLYGQPSYPDGRPRETFTVAVPKIRVVFELEDGNHMIPVLVFKSSAEASVNDWSKQMHMKGRYAFNPLACHPIN